MPDDLRPPPESAHFRWHWLLPPIVAPAEEAEPRLCKWMHNEQWWIEGGARRHSGRELARLVWSYWKPCDPAALIINPEDAGQVERVARELCFQRISYTKGSKDRFVWSRWIDENWIYHKTAAQATLSDLKALADE